MMFGPLRLAAPIADVAESSELQPRRRQTLAVVCL
jgi:hypothetical protein